VVKLYMRAPLAGVDKDLDVPTFDDPSQHHLKTGEANLYTVKALSMTHLVDPASLTDGAISIGLKGRSYYYNPPNDPWCPDVVVVWEDLGGPIAPLAIETDMQSCLNPGGSRYGLRVVTKGNASTVIERLLLLMLTGNGSDDGTLNRIHLEIVRQGVPVVSYTIPDTPQADQQRGQANLYLFPVSVPFTKGDLQADAIRLSIDGQDSWLATNLFLWGVSPKDGRPTTLVPLVYLQATPVYSGTGISTNPPQGHERVILTIAP